MVSYGVPQGSVLVELYSTFAPLCAAIAPTQSDKSNKIGFHEIVYRYRRKTDWSFVLIVAFSNPYLPRPEYL